MIEAITIRGDMESGNYDELKQTPELQQISHYDEGKLRLMETSDHQGRLLQQKSFNESGQEIVLKTLKYTATDKLCSITTAKAESWDENGKMLTGTMECVDDRNKLVKKANFKRLEDGNLGAEGKVETGDGVCFCENGEMTGGHTASYLERKENRLLIPAN